MTGTSGFSNALNSFMDHVWDGFYTGQKRRSRFPSIVRSGDVVTIGYTGTPPEKQMFKYESTEDSIIIKIDYPKAGAYRIRKDSLSGTIVAS